MTSSYLPSWSDQSCTQQARHELSVTACVRLIKRPKLAPRNTPFMEAGIDWVFAWHSWYLLMPPTKTIHLRTRVLLTETGHRTGKCIHWAWDTYFWLPGRARTSYLGFCWRVASVDGLTECSQGPLKCPFTCDSQLLRSFKSQLSAMSHALPSLFLVYTYWQTAEKKRMQFLPEENPENWCQDGQDAVVFSGRHQMSRVTLVWHSCDTRVTLVTWRMKCQAFLPSPAAAGAAGAGDGLAEELTASALPKIFAISMEVVL